MSRPERLLVLGVLVSMGLLYVHLEVRPFIPFDLPEVPRWLVTVLFAAAAIDVIILIGVLGLLVYSGILLLRNRVFPPQVYTTCPDCVALTPVGRYLEGQGCKHCGGRRVYCRNCGKASDVSNFLPGGSGCPQCGHAQFAIR